jgi:hypothetical protein
MEKTPLAEALDYIENQDYNYLEGKTLEFANKLKSFLTELLPKEREMVEKAVSFGQLQDIKKTNFKYPDEYFNENYTQQ